MQFSALDHPPQPSFSIRIDGPREQNESQNKPASKDREIRSLSLRRDCSCGASSFHASGSRRGVLGLVSGDSLQDNNIINLPSLTVPEFVATFNTNNASKISAVISSLNSALLSCANSYPEISNSQEIAASFVAVLTSGALTSPVVIQVLDVLALLFPTCSELVQARYIDEGLTIALIETISSDSIAVVHSTIGLVSVLADTSGYARDSLICLGIHDTLIEISSAGATRGSAGMLDNCDGDDEAIDKAATMVVADPLVDAACSAIHHIFQNENDIDLDTLSSCVEPLLPLLNLQSITAVNFIIDTFVEITNKMPSLVVVLYNVGLYTMAVELLSIPQFVRSSLRLVGNLSIGQPAHVETMLQAGLFDVLVQLLSTQYASDSMWILSNLIEIVTDELLPLIDEEFINSVVVEFSDQSEDTKKEVGFFIATLIVFSPITTNLDNYIKQTVAEVLTEILGCGNEGIVMRALDAIMKIIMYEMNYPEQRFMKLLIDNDIGGHLKELTDSSNKVSARAREVLYWIPQ